MPTREQTATELESLLDPWRAALLRLSAKAARVKPARDRWSISEVVGHLIDSACNNHQRFVRAQFADELVFPRYDQNQWVAAGSYRAGDWESLVQLWYHYNRRLAAIIRNIPDAKLATPCTITPNETCTLGFLITDYVDHLRHHLNILTQRMSV